MSGCDRMLIVGEKSDNYTDTAEQPRLVSMSMHTPWHAYSVGGLGERKGRERKKKRKVGDRGTKNSRKRHTPGTRWQNLAEGKRRCKAVVGDVRSVGEVRGWCDVSE